MISYLLFAGVEMHLLVAYNFLVQLCALDFSYWTPVKNDLYSMMGTTAYTTFHFIS